MWFSELLSLFRPSFEVVKEGRISEKSNIYKDNLQWFLLVVSLVPAILQITLIIRVIKLFFACFLSNFLKIYTYLIFLVFTGIF